MTSGLPAAWLGPTRKHGLHAVQPTLPRSHARLGFGTAIYQFPLLRSRYISTNGSNTERNQMRNKGALIRAQEPDIVFWDIVGLITQAF